MGPGVDRPGPRLRGDKQGQPLSPREREVVEWLTQGLSRVDIASRMGVSEETVKTHLATIYRKLGVTGRYEVAARHLSSSPPTPAPRAATAPPPGGPSAPTEPSAPSEAPSE